MIVLCGAACGADHEKDAPPTACQAATAEVWLASTRHLSSCAPPGDAEPLYWRLTEENRWAEADEKAYLAADRPAIPTVIWIHGNRSDASDAVNDGLAFCEQIRCLGPGGRFRYVIWSWPADRVPGRNRPDVQIKDTRSHAEAVYLARVLAKTRPDVRVCLIGYSFGAQTIAGAMRLLAGGTYAGQTLSEQAARRAPMRAVFIAAAMPASGLADTGSEHSPLRVLDRLLVTVNGCDPALRLYPRLYGRRGPHALGHVGPACLDPRDPNSEKVEPLDVSWAVGKEHDWDRYRSAGPLRARLAWYAFLQPDPGPEPGTGE